MADSQPFTVMKVWFDPPAVLWTHLAPRLA